ncbi:MAG TPA: 50S ribosomal protein L29 [Planctomycetes bacterium]|nr:50S ribosomal protein L29 [Planctomycetota bacterium]
MKKSVKQALRAKTADELKAEADVLQGDMLRARLSTTLEGKRLGIKTRGSRRQIARINTLLRERELAAAKKAN